MSKRPEKYSQQWWERAIREGVHPLQRPLRRLMRQVPAGPRCKTCFAPFAGIGRRIFGPLGYGPSRKNPSWCARCCEWAPLGGAEGEIAVLFADTRGYTTMAEKAKPAEVAALMNRFYAAATDVLCDHDAVIDKVMGDGVMAFFTQGHTNGAQAAECAAAATGLLTAVGYEGQEGPWLPLGIGIDLGMAWVGNVGTEETKDFTALGDVVNTASRLQTEAQAGQIVLSERMYAQVADRFPGARAVSLDLKGKSEPVAARVVELQSHAVS